MSDKFLNLNGVSHLWQKIQAYIDSKITTAVTDGYWTYKIYPDNTFEAWYLRTGMTFNIAYASGNFYRSDPFTFALPTALTNATVKNVQAQVFHANYPVFGAVSTISPIKVQALSGAQRSSNANHTVVIYAFGTV